VGRRNEDIIMELKIESILDYIKYYQENWRSHVNRMDAGRFPKAILRYRPQGKRSIGRSMKRKLKTVTGPEAKYMSGRGRGGSVVLCEALRRADHPSKESYQLSENKL